MTVEHNGETGTFMVHLDRPDTLNALDAALLHELRDDLETAAAAGATGVVLAGNGRAFCAGVDLTLVRSALASDPRSALAPLLDALGPLVLRLRQVPFPTVCALEGPAVGVGMSLALATDLRVAGSSASLIPGYLRIGASPDGGLSATLCQAVGSARFLSALIRNHRFGAQELHHLGLVEEVVDDGGAQSAAVDLLAGLGPVSSLALTRCRSLMGTAWSSTLEEQLDRERELITQLWESADYREGVAAFLEKRSPRYVGA